MVCANRPLYLFLFIDRAIGTFIYFLVHWQIIHYEETPGLFTGKKTLAFIYIARGYILCFDL